MSNEKRIRTLARSRSQILEKLLAIFPMMPGAYKEVYRKCGKSGCWCQQSDKGHPLQRITWTESGESHSKAVADSEVQWVLKATNNFKMFQSLKKELRQLDLKMDDSLKEYGKSQVEKSRNDIA